MLITDSTPAYVLAYLTTGPHATFNSKCYSKCLARHGRWLAHSINDIFDFLLTMVQSEDDIEWTLTMNPGSFIEGKVYGNTIDGERIVLGHFEIFDITGTIEPTYKKY